MRRFLCTAIVLLGFTATLVYIDSDREAEAGSVQTRVLDLNACDQYTVLGRPFNCKENDPWSRANAIRDSVLAGNSNVVTLQEVCRTTFDNVLALLGSSWRGSMLDTVNTGDNRCLDGYVGRWGIAILVRTTNLTNVTFAQLPYDNSERRYLLCGDALISAWFHVCSSHFSKFIGWAEAQSTNVGNQLISYVAGGGAVLLGVDANIDSRNCSEAWRLYRIYISSYGGPYNTSTCQTGSGTMYEADQRHTGGDGYYTQPTFSGGRKLDHIFLSYPSWLADYNAYTSVSTISDHYILRGTGTLVW